MAASTPTKPGNPGLDASSRAWADSNTHGMFVVNITSSFVMVKCTTAAGGVALPSGFTSVAIPPLTARYCQPFRHGASAVKDVLACAHGFHAFISVHGVGSSTAPATDAAAAPPVQQLQAFPRVYEASLCFYVVVETRSAAGASGTYTLHRVVPEDPVGEAAMHTALAVEMRVRAVQSQGCNAFQVLGMDTHTPDGDVASVAEACYSHLYGADACLRALSGNRAHMTLVPAFTAGTLHCAATRTAGEMDEDTYAQACRSFNDSLQTLAASVDVWLSRALAAVYDSTYSQVTNDASLSRHRREMAFDRGALHGEFWGVLKDNPWRIVALVGGSLLVVAGVGIMVVVPVSTPLVAALVYAAGAGVMGAGFGAAERMLSRDSVISNTVEVDGLLKHMAIHALVGVVFGAAIGPASLQLQAALRGFATAGSVFRAAAADAASTAVTTGMLSLGPELANAVSSGRWSQVARTTGASNAVLAILTDVLTAASIGTLSGGAAHVLGAAASAARTFVTTGRLALGVAAGQAFTSTIAASLEPPAPAARAVLPVRSSLLATMDSLAGGAFTRRSAAFARASTRSVTIDAARLREAAAQPMPYISLINLCTKVEVRLVIIPVDALTGSLLLDDPRKRLLYGGDVAVLAPPTGAAAHYLVFPQTMRAVLLPTGNWFAISSELRTEGGSSSLILHRDALSTSRTYVARGPLYKEEVIEAYNVFRDRLHDDVAAAEGSAWVGRVKPASIVTLRAPAFAERMGTHAETHMHITLHSKLWAVFARMMVACTVVMDGVPRRVHVCARHEESVYLPDTAVNIVVWVEALRALPNGWAAVKAYNHSRSCYGDENVPETFMFPSPITALVTVAGLSGQEVATLQLFARQTRLPAAREITYSIARLPPAVHTDVTNWTRARLEGAAGAQSTLAWHVQLRDDLTQQVHVWTRTALASMRSMKKSGLGASTLVVLPPGGTIAAATAKRTAAASVESPPTSGSQAAASTRAAIRTHAMRLLQPVLFGVCEEDAAQDALVHARLMEMAQVEATHASIGVPADAWARRGGYAAAAIDACMELVNGMSGEDALATAEDRVRVLLRVVEAWKGASAGYMSADEAWPLMSFTFARAEARAHAEGRTLRLASHARLVERWADEDLCVDEARYWSFFLVASVESWLREGDGGADEDVVAHDSDAPPRTPAFTAAEVDARTPSSPLASSPAAAGERSAVVVGVLEHPAEDGGDPVPHADDEERV